MGSHLENYAEEAFAPVVDLSQNLALFAVLIALGVGLVSALVAGRFIGPIKALAGAAQEVSSGNTTIELPVKSKDEIGLLTENFNHMVVNLRDQRAANRGKYQIIAECASAPDRRAFKER